MYNYKIYYGWYDENSCYIFQNEEQRNFNQDIINIIDTNIQELNYNEYITIENIFSLLFKYLPMRGYNEIEFEEVFSINSCSIIQKYDIDKYFDNLKDETKLFIVNHNKLIQDDNLR